MRIKQFSTLAGADFDKFLTAFCKIQDAVRVGVYRTGLSPYPVWLGFMCQPTPFLKEFWIIEDGLGRAIGRIGANLSASRPKEGAIGFFEVDLKHPEAAEAGRALLAAAEAWLKENRASTFLGPMNFNSWYQYRFRIDAATDDPLFNWEPIHPPEYVDIWKSAGYQATSFFATEAHQDLAGFAAQSKGAYERLTAEGYRFRPVDLFRDGEVDIRSLYDVSMKGLSSNPQFEPISPEAFRALHVAMSAKTNLTHLAFDAKGEAVAFVVAFEDHGYAVYRRRAVVPESHGLELTVALQHAVAEAALKRGLSKFLTALRPVDSETGGSAVWTHRYALFSKSLVE